MNDKISLEKTFYFDCPDKIIKERINKIRNGGYDNDYIKNFYMKFVDTNNNENSNQIKTGAFYLVN